MRKRFKKYRIVAELSSSVWTMVYRAIQEPLDRPVSLKILSPKLGGADEQVKRFEREAKICANLVHRNIVRLFDYGQWRGEYFIVQEWVEGSSLKELLSGGKLPIDIATYILSEVSAGLAFAHGRKIIHRDIKPGNVLIGQDGSVKITDFGLACSMNLPEITLEGTFLGTPAYSSPEQIRGSKLDERSDIFSLGVVAYEMLTGTNPFSANSYSEIIERICHTRPKYPERINPSIPPELGRVIRRMIAKRPLNRYRNPDEVLADLDGLTKTRKESAHRLGLYLSRTPSEITKPSAAQKKRIPAWLYPTIVGAAGVTLLAGIIFMPHRPALVSLQESLALSDSTAVRDSSITEAGGESDNSKELINQSEPGYQENPPIVPDKSFVRLDVKPWARVYVDGQYWETTPTDRLLVLEPGRHRLSFENDYLAAFERVINPSPGDTVSVSVDLTRNTSWLSVSVKPWGEVYLDGAYISTTPISDPIKARPGTHTLKVTHPSLEPFEGTVSLQPGDTLVKLVELRGDR